MSNEQAQFAIDESDSASPRADDTERMNHIASYERQRRCSTDRGATWGGETLLSDRTDGAAYKSAQGFKAFYGHYGGAAIDAGGRLHAVWGAGEPGYRTGTVWVNSVDGPPISGRE